MSNDAKPDKLAKATIALGYVSIFAVLFRAWVLFAVAFALFVGVSIWRRIIKNRGRKQNDAQTSYYPDDEKRDASTCVCEQVSRLVNALFSNAKWVWAQPDTTRRIASGEDVYIILNSAGGYRRAKVDFVDGVATAVTPIMASVRPMPEMLSKTSAETHEEQTMPINYELIAFEWKDTHILDLNERINNAIGRGEAEIIIKADELPIRESWLCICEELRREGLDEVVCAENEIRIKIMQKTA